MTVETLEAVRKSVYVSAPVERAWDVFVNRIDAWWPTATHSIGGTETAAAVLDEARIYERTLDGTEHTWGDVLVWEPPSRLALAWQVHDAAGTEVEVTFTPEGEGTRVDLVHSGWRTETLRASYDGGWSAVLGCYAGAVSP